MQSAALKGASTKAGLGVVFTRTLNPAVRDRNRPPVQVAPPSTDFRISGFGYADMRIRVIWEGKTKDPRLLALQADYKARIEHFGELKIEDISPHAKVGRGAKEELSGIEKRLLEKLEKQDGGRKIVLDERGKEWTSDEFARWMAQSASQGARELVFMVGGAEGFSAAFRDRADLVLSLSRMTLTRDWARTLLLEQIYRAYTIERGYPYPR
jgi:23S rRNA (pseudouridine1915-N3)-methyltransferase